MLYLTIRTSSREPARTSNECAGDTRQPKPVGRLRQLDRFRECANHLQGPASRYYILARNENCPPCADRRLQILAFTFLRESVQVLSHMLKLCARGDRVARLHAGIVACDQAHYEMPSVAPGGLRSGSTEVCQRKTLRALPPAGFASMLPVTSAPDSPNGRATPSDIRLPEN